MIMDITIAKGNEKTVAAFAVACTTFREPALNVLWRAQSTLGFLIKCMPSSLWEVVENRPDDGDLRLVRTIVWLTIARKLVTLLGFVS